MHIGNHIRSAALGTLFALTVIGLPVIQADAKAPNPQNDESKFCTLTYANGYIEFFPAGATVRIENTMFTCKDGEWVHGLLPSTTNSPVGPRPGVASPAP